MGGWKNVNHGTAVVGSVNNNDTEMAARRILTGLGISRSELSDAERTLFGDGFGDESLWSRAVRLWESKSGLKFGHMLYEAIPPTVSSVSRFSDESKVLAVRVRNSDICVAFFAMTPEAAAELVPPFTVAGRSPSGKWIIRENLEDFVRQTARRGD